MSDNSSSAQYLQTPGPKKHSKRSAAGRAVSATSQGSKPPVESRASQRGRPASAAPGAFPSPSAPISTPAKAIMDQKAYAAPSFSASPAPSSLPVPRFCKSAPGGNAAIPNSRIQATPPTTIVSPQKQPVTLGQTPSNALDMLFNAQKSERAKQWQQPSNRSATGQTPSRSHTPEHSKQNMFVMELDDAESPAARRVEKMARNLQREASPNPSTYRDPQIEAEERARATNDLKARLGLAPSRTPQPSPFSLDPHYYPQQPSSRADISTPPHGYQPDGLLYGDRNLSPMFQAARSTPNERSRYPPAAMGGSPMPAFRQNSPFHANHQPGHTPPPQSQSQQFYANQGQMSFPKEQLRQAQTPPQMPNQANLLFGVSAGPSIQQEQAQNGGRDIQGMESDLRRILKLG